MKTHDEITIKIKAKFGSDLQQSNAIESLKGLINTWKYFYRATHAKNEIEVDIEEAKVSTKKYGKK